VLEFPTPTLASKASLTLGVDDDVDDGVDDNDDRAGDAFYFLFFCGFWPSSSTV
jgi:hypothetical protein